MDAVAILRQAMSAASNDEAGLTTLRAEREQRANALLAAEKTFQKNQAEFTELTDQQGAVNEVIIATRKQLDSLRQKITDAVLRNLNGVQVNAKLSSDSDALRFTLLQNNLTLCLGAVEGLAQRVLPAHIKLRLAMKEKKEAELAWTFADSDCECLVFAIKMAPGLNQPGVEMTLTPNSAPGAYASATNKIAVEIDQLNAQIAELRAMLPKKG